MAKYTRSTLTGDNAPVNAELEKIQSAIDDQFDRNPTTGEANQLDGSLDANSNRIYNLAAPKEPNDAARLKDIQASSNANPLPDATGQANEFLRTDGETAYWAPVTKETVGLADVDNTSDINKPVSTAQQTEINTRGLQVDTFVNLELLTPTTTGQAFICQGRVNAQYILMTDGYVALAGDATCANGRVLALQVSEGITTSSFGAVADYSAGTQTGTDNTQAFNDCKTRANLAKITFIMGGGNFYFDGSQLHFDQEGVYKGQGIDNTVLFFGGSPTKSMQTFIVWRSEYNSGDYSASADADVAYGVKVSRSGTVLEDFSIATATEYSGYSTPWNSTTDAPTSNYDYGLLVTQTRCTVNRVRALGTWTQYGGSINGTTNAFGDGFSTKDSYFSGMTGFGVVGPQGQPDGSGGFLALAAGDTRCTGGMSDLDFHRFTCYSTFTDLKTRLRIDGVNTRVRRVANGVGGLYISGQAGNAAGLIQGMYFFDCRFSGGEATSYKIDYANRVEFHSMHSDKNSDTIDVDGSALSNSDFNYIITANATNVKYIGGKASGGVDARTRINAAGERIFSEFGYESLGKMALSADVLSDSGTFTPELSGSSGTATYGARSAQWVKIGNLVKLWGRIDVTSIDTLTGPLTIPIPFTAVNIGNSEYPATFGIIRNIETLDGFAGAINGGAAEISLYRYVTDDNIDIFNQADMSNGARIDFTVDILI